jgi:hypothetical protein
MRLRKCGAPGGALCGTSDLSGTAPLLESVHKTPAWFESGNYLHAAFIAAAVASLRICLFTRQGSRSCRTKSMSSVVCL